MMKLISFIAFALLPAILLEGDPTPPHPMVPSAVTFLEAFSTMEQRSLLLPFDHSERTDWSYLPGRRAGLALGDMTELQREAGLALLRSALSDMGYRKTTGVIALEGILGEMERSRSRDPGRYWFTLFGRPSGSDPWGWRLEGHHLSINFSSISPGLIATTPVFLGAHPATVPFGEQKGLRVLGEEEDRARALINSMTADQKRKAIISTSAPRDIITGNDRRARMSRFEGIPYRDLTSDQQHMLRSLLGLYHGNMEESLADSAWERIQIAGLDGLYFAWAGAIAPGGPHYYRIHGPTFVVEFDNTQNNANHVHSVWRDFENDFGEDLLKKHYEQKTHD